MIRVATPPGVPSYTRALELEEIEHRDRPVSDAKRRQHIIATYLSQEMQVAEHRGMLFDASNSAAAYYDSVKDNRSVLSGSYPFPLVATDSQVLTIRTEAELLAFHNSIRARRLSLAISMREALREEGLL